MGDGEVRQDRPVRRRLDRRFLSGRFQVSFIDRSIVPLHSSSSDMFRKTTADESRVEQCSSGTCPNPSRYPGEPLLCTAPIKVTIYFNFANVFDQCWGCFFFCTETLQCSCMVINCSTNTRITRRTTCTGAGAASGSGSSTSAPTSPSPSSPAVSRTYVTGSGPLTRSIVCKTDGERTLLV
jgi:hypothetical protein